jgi:hypothetical protein
MELSYKVKIEIDKFYYDFEVIVEIEKESTSDLIEEQILENLYNEICYAIKSDVKNRKSI